jgi:predicted Zn finger-like uncharacterized protein
MMLLTRCPECRTTFRITADALEVASGQVRCGRCSAVFDAYEELKEETAAEPESAQPVAAADPGDDPLARTDEFAVPEGAFAAAADALGEPAGDDGAIAEVMQQIRVGMSLESADSDSASTATASASEARDGTVPTDVEIAPEQVDAVLAEDGPAASVPLLAPWRPEAPARRQPSRWWAFAAALAALALVAQLVHQYRAELAARPIVGQWLTGTYAAFGVTLTPNWDLRQYQIIDWIASADASERGPGSLNITARIHNRGPDAQPFPHVHLELKDRWDTPVGSRVFHPAEYLVGNSAGALMAPGSTARARLSVVDPGEDAYGFQLDVCIETSQGGLRCATDEIFR